jgi:hypothetical protein
LPTVKIAADRKAVVPANHVPRLGDGTHDQRGRLLDRIVSEIRAC